LVDFMIVGAAACHQSVMDGLRLGSLAVVVLLATLAWPARAAVTGLSFQGPSECPAEAEFVAAVEARGGRFDFLRSDGADRSLEISIRRVGPSFHGSLKVRARDGASDSREVHAEHCGEVVDGLAVVTAIALRGAPGTLIASTTDEVRNNSAVPQPEVGVPPPAPTDGASEDTRLHAKIGPGTESIRVAAGKVDVSHASTASISAGVVFGLIPGLTLPRYDLSLSTANFITPPDGRHYLVGLVTRLRVSLLGEDTYRTVNTSTHIVGVGFGIDLCRSPYYDTRGLVLLVCAEYAGGSMTFDTQDAVAGKTLSKTVGFGTAGLNAELQYNLSRYVHVDLRVGSDLTIGSPLTAERADGSEIFRARQVGISGYAVAGIGFHF
jgi:hypothetical protein